MKISNLKFQISSVLWLTYAIGIVILTWTIIKSGYYFQFNADEVFNANTVYLMSKGYKPYADFYTVYSPIVHWVLAPIFLVFGFNFEAVSMARVAMIGFFLIRILLMYWLAARVFGKRVGLLFIPLYLLSPFAVFSEMQIRPDNLMMVFYILFLLAFSYKKYFLTGVLLAVTALTNIKIAPSLGAFGIVFLYYILQRKKFATLMQFINGFCLTCLVFFAYFFINGYAGEMFQHVFLDPVMLNNSIPHPTWLGYFYFTNPTIYGLDGKQWNWIFTWTLPTLAFAGGYARITQSPGVKVQNEQEKDLMPLILFLSLFIQWLSMLFINSVFLQYYIPLNWLYALFAAYFIDSLLSNHELSRNLQRALIVFLVVIGFLIYKNSLQSNIARSKMTFDPIVKDMNQYWKLIPENEPAFPNVVFREPIYPILWGSTFAPYMRERYPPVYRALEKHKPTILTGLNDEYFSFLDYESQQYLLTHYQRDLTDGRIWKLK